MSDQDWENAWAPRSQGDPVLGFGQSSSSDDDFVGLFGANVDYFGEVVGGWVEPVSIERFNNNYRFTFSDGTTVMVPRTDVMDIVLDGHESGYWWSNRPKGLTIDPHSLGVKGFALEVGGSVIDGILVFTAFQNDGPYGGTRELVALGGGVITGRAIASAAIKSPALKAFVVVASGLVGEEFVAQLFDTAFGPVAEEMTERFCLRDPAACGLPWDYYFS
ncbi:MAG: hypothetical protein GY722_15860 [bacterium]|nr:hypothetical protein [bacterium]